MPDPDFNQGPDERAGRGFWTTLPGILTGLAALITAIVGLLSLLREPRAVQDDSRASSSGQISEVSGSTESAVLDGSPGDVLTRGRITMQSVDNVDLETGMTGTPPGVDLYLYCSGTSCILNGMQSLMTATDTAESRDACIVALKSRQEQTVNSPLLREGLVICIQTAEGHVGRMQVVSVPGPGTAEFDFDYTLWR